MREAQFHLKFQLVNCSYLIAILFVSNTGFRIIFTYPLEQQMYLLPPKQKYTAKRTFVCCVSASSPEVGRNKDPEMIYHYQQSSVNRCEYQGFINQILTLKCEMFGCLSISVSMLVKVTSLSCFREIQFTKAHSKLNTHTLFTRICR